MGLVITRRQGLTRNVSRLVTPGVLMPLCLIYALGTLIWWISVRTPEALHAAPEIPTVNWTYLLLGAMIAVLTSYELWKHAQAMVLKQSSSVQRLLTHLAMVLLMIVMIVLNVTRWQWYLDELGSAYRDSLSSQSAAPATD